MKDIYRRYLSYNLAVRIVTGIVVASNHYTLPFPMSLKNGLERVLSAGIKLVSPKTGQGLPAVHLLVCLSSEVWLGHHVFVRRTSLQNAQSSNLVGNAVAESLVVCYVLYKHTKWRTVK